EQSILGLDIDYARGTQAELGRQRAGQQADALGEARTQYLAESRDSFRKLDPVDAILKIGMIAAHVNLPERILGHAGRLQQHLVELRISTLRQFLDGLLA